MYQSAHLYPSPPALHLPIQQTQPHLPTYQVNLTFTASSTLPEYTSPSPSDVRKSNHVPRRSRPRPDFFGKRVAGTVQRDLTSRGSLSSPNKLSHGGQFRLTRIPGPWLFLSALFGDFPPASVNKYLSRYRVTYHAGVHVSCLRSSHPQSYVLLCPLPGQTGFGPLVPPAAAAFVVPARTQQ